MTADLDPRDADLAARLRALGTQPVDTALQSEHLTAMAGVRSGSAFRSALGGRVKIGAGVLAGFLLGATGLTTAGAMGPLQPIASSAVRAVTPLDAPHGRSADAPGKQKDKAEDGDDASDGTESGPKRLGDGRSIGTLRNWAGCEDNDAGNRGQYLKAVREAGGDLEAAKASECGKPLADGATADEPKTDDTTADDAGKPDEPGKSADAATAGDAGKAKAAENKDAARGKAGDAPAGGKPETAPSVPDVADDRNSASDGATGTDQPGATPAGGGDAAVTSADS